MNTQEELQTIRSYLCNEIEENISQIVIALEAEKAKNAELMVQLEAEKAKNAEFMVQLEAEKEKNDELIDRVRDLEAKNAELMNQENQFNENSSAMNEARKIMIDGCLNIQPPSGVCPAIYRSLVVLKSAALLDEPCEERQGLVHSNGSLTCQEEQRLTGFQDNNDKGNVKGGKTHLQYFVNMYELPEKNGVYGIGLNKTQKSYQNINKNAKCLISLNKLKKDGSLGKRQGGVWKYILVEGEENEGFYDRINRMLNL